MERKKILLVEDNPDDEALTIRALTRAKVANEVIVVRDGVEALDYLFKDGDEPAAGTDLPQVILLDLKLPKIDGLEVLRRVRANDKTKYIPVVILTSSDEEKDLVEGYRLGANSYVQKPVDFTEFADAVQQLGLYWLLVNQLPPATA
ncbi:MAG: response regulator [bacterium]|nr:response regulator [bacterium]